MSKTNCIGICVRIPICKKGGGGLFYKSYFSLVRDPSRGGWAPSTQAMGGWAQSSRAMQFMHRVWDLSHTLDIVLSI
jgi:hypothetical protein